MFLLTSNHLASAAPVTIDFTTDDFGTPLSNGQKIDVGQEFGNFVIISSPQTGSTHLGLAIFDTTPGVNPADPDLQVNLGNAMILQDLGSPAMTGDFFDSPNDEAFAGTDNHPSNFGQAIYDFSPSPGRAVHMDSILLIDINGNAYTDVKLIDGAGRERLWDIDEHWTRDIAAEGPDGYQVLDLQNAANQQGEAGGWAVFSEDAGFDITDVVRMEVTHFGSAGHDDIKFTAQEFAKLGDLVWNDLDEDGIQDGNEPGVEGVKVTLTGGGPDGVIGSGGDDTMEMLFTDMDGEYLFENLHPGEEYKVTFSQLPTGFDFTLQNQGGDDTVDSDADPLTGMTQIVTLSSGQINLTLDAGIFDTTPPGNPIPEPSAALLALLGLAGFMTTRRPPRRGSTKPTKPTR